MSKKIAICFPKVAFVKGGAELHAESLDKELRKRGFDSCIVNMPYKGYPKNELLKQALMWRMLDLSESDGMKIDMVIGTRFPSYMIQHPNKVIWLIHQHRAAYDLFGTEYSDFTYVPQDLDLMNKIRNADIKTISEASAVYTNAKNTRNRLKKFNGIDSEALYHPPKHIGKYRNDGYGNYILSVGRLDPLKRIDLLIEALRYTDKNIKCFIAGTGLHKQKLEKLAKNWGLEERIKFLGFVEDEKLIELYASCFAVYYAPYDEDYGYVTLEAFLSEKPVITAIDSGGVLEFVRNCENGYVCENEPQQMAEKISSLYENKGLCQQLGMEGYKLVEPISWDYAIEKLTATL